MLLLILRYYCCMYVRVHWCPAKRDTPSACTAGSTRKSRPRDLWFPRWVIIMHRKIRQRLLDGLCGTLFLTEVLLRYLWQPGVRRINTTSNAQDCLFVINNSSSSSTSVNYLVVSIVIETSSRKFTASTRVTARKKVDAVWTTMTARLWPRNW